MGVYLFLDSEAANLVAAVSALCGGGLCFVHLASGGVAVQPVVGLIEVLNLDGAHLDPYDVDFALHHVVLDAVGLELEMVEYM